MPRPILFFVSIGMLFDPQTILHIWHWAILGTAVLMISKILIVALIVRWSGIDALTAWRTGLMLATGGEFGFALVAIALTADAVDARVGQIVLTSVLFSIIAAPFLIRYNYRIARLFAARPIRKQAPDVPRAAEIEGQFQDHVVICGYGRIGQSVGHFLEEEKIPYVAVDLDSSRVRRASRCSRATRPSGTFSKLWVSARPGYWLLLMRICPRRGARWSMQSNCVPICP